MSETATEKTTHTIDATDQKMGRLASEVAILLMGKNRPDFSRNKVAPVTVVVENIDALDIPAKKMREKEYDTYTGYPGGLYRTSLEKVVADKGTAEAFKKAVFGMLPGNRLRPLMMKNLSIK
tara:strand:+ start:46 stop:411 length:366 start_codon:yes stop_codon:yes gene_type:complete